MPAGAAIIAPKHQCMFDIFGSLAFLPDGCFVLKKELLSIPFFGWWALRCGMIVVDRDGHSAALRKLVTDARDRLDEARQVVIFPEGTRVRVGETPPLAAGFAGLYKMLKLPVVPTH
jgi:1-acyl-sn-glycerol-3-phosphate acyltransferase